MFFTEQQLQQAIRLKSLGLTWKPSAGHYIYDAARLLKPTSPFQKNVYFLLDISCFIRAVGDPKTFQQSMVWLPTWEHARQILGSLNVPESRIAAQLRGGSGGALGEELDQLYQLIEAALEAN